MNRREQLIICQMFTFGVYAIVAAVTGRADVFGTPRAHTVNMDSSLSDILSGRYQHEEEPQEEPSKRGPMITDG